MKEIKESEDVAENMTNGYGGIGNQVIFENRIVREWLSTEEAAFILAISANALRIMVHRGQIQAYKLGDD